MDLLKPSDATTDAPVIFRGKKRKFFRQRPLEDEATGATGPATESIETQDETIASPKTATQVEEALSVAEIIRQRNARKSRTRGVGFGADDAHGSAFHPDVELSLMIREEEQRADDLASGGVNRRFAAQTGLTSELVNKHMMEYIESELAKRKSAASSIAGTSVGPSSEATGAAQNMPHDTPKPITQQGKLMEIDLGDDVRNRNEAMTDLARRRLQGERIQDEQPPKPKKARLGRDGKPWRPRNRRDSDAIKRDQLVEDILRENRLDVYETPIPPPTSTPGLDDDGAADDRIAEEFRREFMEAMAERQQKKKPVPGVKKDEEVLKGPKLGGSRNARAAMRDMMLKKDKEGKR